MPQFKIWLFEQSWKAPVAVVETTPVQAEEYIQADFEEPDIQLIETSQNEMSDKQVFHNPLHSLNPAWVINSGLWS